MAFQTFELFSVLKADDIVRLDGILDRNSGLEVLRFRL
jgi:hypothetical protein